MSGRKGPKITEQQFAVYCCVRDAGRWMDASEIATNAKVNQRTARAHARKLADLGVFELNDAFAGYRYRLAANSTECEYRRKLELAEEIFSKGQK